MAIERAVVGIEAI